MAVFLAPATINGRAYLAPNAPPAVVDPPVDGIVPTFTGTLSSARTVSSITVDWSATTSSDNVAVARREYRIGGSGAYTPASAQDETSRQHMFTGLAPSTVYQIEVRCVDTSGNLSQALSISVTTSAAPAPTVTSVTVSPAAATVSSGTTLQLSAVAAGANNPAQTFTWAVVQGFGDTTANGLYTPPAAAAAARTAKVRATSTIDPSKYGEAIITIPAVTNPSGTPMSYSASKARTINATTSSTAPFAAPVVGFWALSNPKKPYGIKDPNATIDISVNWAAILADIEDTINPAASSVEVSTGATNAGDQIIGGIQTVFVAGGLAGRTSVTFRIQTNSTPPRVFDRTVELQIEDQ